jgi:GTP cyclohydrolase IA
VAKPRRSRSQAAVRAVARPRVVDQASIEGHVRGILADLGEDPDREGLVKTPSRVARAYEFLTKGYREDPRSIIQGALFVEDYQEMIVCRDINFFSLCEHHLLPFSGRATVAYLPKHHIVGLSKLARLVEVFARRFQVQERMTTQIATTLMDELEAEHLCMRMRGVEKQNSKVVTSAMLGAFRSHQETRQEFMTLYSNGR